MQWPNWKRLLPTSELPLTVAAVVAVAAALTLVLSWLLVSLGWAGEEPGIASFIAGVAVFPQYRRFARIARERPAVLVALSVPCAGSSCCSFWGA